MKLTHQQARRHFEAALDTARFYARKPALDAALTQHLAECPACQAYTAQSSSIDAHLAQHMPQAWPAPGISSYQLDQAIHKVHHRISRKSTLNRQNFWNGMRHAWRWGIGLAGIALLVGILVFSKGLLPHNTSAPGVPQPSLTEPILPSQTALPTPTAAQVPQGAGAPAAGEWEAATDFGRLVFSVDPTGTRVNKISYLFSEWTWCGTSTLIHSSEIVDAAGALMIDNQFSIQSTFDRNLQDHMLLQGTYDPASQRFFGTWEELSGSTICSGTWEASVPTPAPAPTDTPPPTATVTFTPSPSPTDTSTPSATITFTSSPTETPVPASALDLALNPEDLGEGWLLDAEVTDLNARYFIDRGEDGKAIIWTNQTGYSFWLDPALAESISMRGFSQPEQKWVLFQVVAVLKESAQAEEEFKGYMPDCDLPCEQASVYDDGSGDRGVYRDVAIGDEAVVGSGGDTLEEFFPYLTFLHFRKGQVIVSLVSLGQLNDLANAPPMDESRLEELARIIEARIP